MRNSLKEKMIMVLMLLAISTVVLIGLGIKIAGSRHNGASYPTTMPENKVPGDLMPSISSTPDETQMPTETPSPTEISGPTEMLAAPTETIQNEVSEISPTVMATTYPTNMPSLFPTEEPEDTPAITVTGTPPVMPENTPAVTPTLIPTKQPSNTPTLFPTIQPVNTPTALPTKQPVNPPTPTVQPTVSPTIRPTSEPGKDEKEVLDFSKNVDRFDESFFTISCKGTYRIKSNVNYYNADGSFAGRLKAGDIVYANGSNTYYKNLTTYKMSEGILSEFMPECGKAVYQVVINDKIYYMIPADLYGSYMGAGAEYPADADETEAFCIAEGLTKYSHGNIWYYDETGKKQYEHVYDVNKDGVWYFVSIFNMTRITDNYLTHRIPWGNMWTRFENDPAEFEETDSTTGHQYIWKADTFMFIDMDFDGICEYEVTVEQWFKWQALN